MRKRLFTAKSQISSWESPEEKGKYRMLQYTCKVCDKSRTFLDSSHQRTHGEVAQKVLRIKGISMFSASQSWGTGYDNKAFLQFIPVHFNNSLFTFYSYSLSDKNCKEFCSNFHFLLHLSASTMGISLSLESGTYA